MAVIWQAAALVAALTHQAPERIECFADRPMVFQRGSITRAAEQGGSIIVTYRIDQRELIEIQLSIGLDQDREHAAAIVEERIEKNPAWLDQLTHSALGQSRALALEIRRFPAIAIGDRVYYTDHIDEALQRHAETRHAQ